MKPESLRQRDQLLWGAALAMSPCAEDKTYAPEDVLRSLVKVLPRDDPEKQHRKKAEHFYQQMSHPGATEPNGQLSLFGDLYPYEPTRPVIGPEPEKRVVQQQFAPPAYKAAEAKRAREKEEDLHVWAERKTRESEGYSAWALTEAIRGRPPLELVFGNYVKESGIHRK